MSNPFDSFLDDDTTSKPAAAAAAAAPPPAAAAVAELPALVMLHSNGGGGPSPAAAAPPLSASPAASLPSSVSPSPLPPSSSPLPHAADEFADLDRAALPFITVTPDDKFALNPEAVAYLRSLHGRVAVVAIAGIYRTGKSYLLNQLMGKNAAFAVGPTVRAQTKGIWIWGRAVPSPDGSDTHVLFMDTEGLGSTVRSETYDTRIFALALLLSSFFIYNSFGTIDGNAIANLSLVVHLTKHIRVRAAAGGKEDPGTEFNAFFPNFLWVVRDFAVRLERDGRKITAREYLEDALKPESGGDESADAKNAVRLMIRSFFPDRDCTVLVRPVSDERALMNLSAVPPEGLRPEFRSGINAMRKRVLGGAKPKSLFGRPLNGAMLASLAEQYVAVLNAGGTPTISNAWDRVVDAQCAEAVEEGTAAYVRGMHEALAACAAAAVTATAVQPASPAPPAPLYDARSTIVEDDDFRSAHAAASLSASRAFHSRAVQDPDKTPPYEAKLRATVDAEASKLRRANEEASRVLCVAALDRLHGATVGSVMAAVRGAPAAAGAGTISSPSSSGGAAATATQSFTTAAAPPPTPAAIPTATLVRAYRAAMEALFTGYAAEARGPARDRVLCEFVGGPRLTAVLLEAGVLVDASTSAMAGAMAARIAELNSSLAAARGREQAANELMSQERASFETTLAEHARIAADEGERLRFALESRGAELDRLSSKFDRLQAAMDAAGTRAEEAAARSAAALSAAQAKHAELAGVRMSALADTGALALRLADAEAARGDADRLAADHRAALLEEAKAMAIAVERCRAAENETIRLREQTELLTESLQTLKELLRAKADEKEEVEFQWGTAKARLFQKESELSSLQEELEVMASLATHLKSALAGGGASSAKGGIGGKAQPKALTLTRAEQAAFDRLLAPP